MFKKVSIIGFGHFGKTLYRLLKDDFEMIIYDKNRKVLNELKGKIGVKAYSSLKDLKEVYKSEVIFYCIPISAFEDVVSSHKQYLANQLLIDVLSVKQHPALIFKKCLRNTKTEAILTHPMFGPDSSRNGFEDLPIVMNNLNASRESYKFWKKYFIKNKLRVVEITPKEHDKLAANSQGVTHFIGRLLKEFDIKPTRIDTLGAKKLQEIMDQTCNDTWELFLDLQTYNLYTKKMRVKFGKAYNSIYNKLLPKRISSKYIIYGIQGGIGSFNDEAVNLYIKKNKIKDYKIKYLYTTKKVLKNLHVGNIDYGLFAIHNSVGGVVQESIKAISNYKFKIVEEFSIPIKHFLMKRKDIKKENIDTFMTHPQVLKQCKSSIKRKYPEMELKSGKGDLIGTAKVAYALSKGEIDGKIAVLGPKQLAKMYDLEIIDKNLQDDKDNTTSFLLVRRNF